MSDPVPHRSEPQATPEGEEPKLRLRIVFGEGAMLGPGKADLLERIGETGSIAAAGRSMGMSYKRAWMLVETLNEIFADPLVTSTRGGTAGGGAVLTDTGKRVLTCYREIESQARRSTAHEIDTLSSLLKYPPDPATPDDTA